MSKKKQTHAIIGIRTKTGVEYVQVNGNLRMLNENKALACDVNFEFMHEFWAELMNYAFYVVRECKEYKGGEVFIEEVIQT